MSAEDFRATAQALAERAKTDTAFQAALLNDPVGTLTAAGLSAEAAQQLVDGDTAADVQGYAMVRDTQDGCNDTTCWTSGCPGSCSVTMCGTTWF